MKSFKKVMAGMLMGIMVIGMLTGCGGDPVADDFEKFLNTDMVDVNANYDKIKEESAKWGDLETNERKICKSNGSIQRGLYKDA